MEYIAYLHKDKGSDYGVSFPDFPGAITAGSTLEEARRMAGEVLALHIAGMREEACTLFLVEQRSGSHPSPSEGRVRRASA
jgi:predicted RNase H-like HicB family nuclease